MATTNPLSARRLAQRTGVVSYVKLAPLPEMPPFPREFVKRFPELMGYAVALDDYNRRMQEWRQNVQAEFDSRIPATGESAAVQGEINLTGGTSSGDVAAPDNSLLWYKGGVQGLTSPSDLFVRLGPNGPSTFNLFASGNTWTGTTTFAGMVSFNVSPTFNASVSFLWPVWCQSAFTVEDRSIFNGPAEFHGAVTSDVTPEVGGSATIQGTKLPTARLSRIIMVSPTFPLTVVDEFRRPTVFVPQPPDPPLEVVDQRMPLVTVQNISTGEYIPVVVTQAVIPPTPPDFPDERPGLLIALADGTTPPADTYHIVLIG